MKKLMIAAAIVCVAAFAQAASLNWGVSNVYKPGTSEKANGWNAMLFITSDTTGKATTTTLAAVVALIGTEDWTTSVAALATTSASLSAAGTISTVPTGLDGFDSGDSISGFAIVFDSDSLEKAGKYYLVNDGDTKTASFTSATGSKTFAFGSQATASADAKNWTSIPEPTSGLLLLLGVAGLALRRKQK